ncbi:MAG TPA: GYD domain-containing protein [Terriglobales bacterium]|nr:GYD domain-containing protein [Terriglobales bacterium]
MPTYVCLFNWTQKGIEEVKGSPKRLDAVKKTFSELGVEIKEFYLTMGRHDLVVIMEAKDDAAMARGLLALGSRGAVRTETLRAFGEGDYRKIIGSLP